MTIEVPPAELYGLATTLRAAASGAEEYGARLAGTPTVGAPLQAAVDGLLESHLAAATALAGELHWLAVTIAGVADSWCGLDGSLLAARGQVAPR